MNTHKIYHQGLQNSKLSVSLYVINKFLNFSMFIESILSSSAVKWTTFSVFLSWTWSLYFFQCVRMHSQRYVPTHPKFTYSPSTLVVALLTPTTSPCINRIVLKNQLLLIKQDFYIYKIPVKDSAALLHSEPAALGEPRIVELATVAAVLSISPSSSLTAEGMDFQISNIYKKDSNISKCLLTGSSSI